MAGVKMQLSDWVMGGPGKGRPNAYKRDQGGVAL